MDFYTFVIESAPPGADLKAWKFTYGHHRESRVRAQYERLVKALRPLHRLRLRQASAVLAQDTGSETAPTPGYSAPTTPGPAGQGPAGQGPGGFDVDDIAPPDNWISPDDDY